MKVEPQKEHHWLQQLVGEWAVETECIMGPDQPPSTFESKESVRSLGGVWVVCEGGCPTPDGRHAINLMTLGYDPAKKRFVGTFVSSMMTLLWLYDGQLDEAEKVLSLAAEGPNFADPSKTAKFVDAIEIVDADHRVLTSRYQADDGQWHLFMTSKYRRVK